MLRTYKLPPAFYADHTARALPEEGVSRVVHETKAYVWVEMDRAAYDDLLGDCRFYADDPWMFDPPLPGLCHSARTTARRLEAEPFDEREES